MASIRDRFRNVIACEDVRAEVGNKKSLMGVFGGDIVVSEIPANIQIALYIGYTRENVNESEALKIIIMQDKDQIAEMKLDIPQGGDVHTAIILPRSVIAFAKECQFTLSASVNDGKVYELLRKTVRKGPVEPR